MTADLLPRLQSALGSQYAVERELGRGGMATVYLARDLRHDRPVALKVLHPELAAVIGAERFLTEIRVTANLQHPHILPLFDSGHAEELLYYVMPFVSGESLRARLVRETQLPVEDAVRIAKEAASALDYAHRQGVVHRDIKPENILLHDGTALVADFGIALAVTKAGGNRLTQTGLSLGTPHYMSPEQATGDREIDGRSDVYALASTLYEMLVGEPPFTGPSSQAVIAKLLTEAAPVVTAARPATPAPVAAALGRALQKLPADRFGSAAQFAAALEVVPSLPVTQVMATAHRGTSRGIRIWQAIAGCAVAVAGAALWWGVRRPPPDSDLQLARQLTFEGTVRATAISPDGKWLAYVTDQCPRGSPGSCPAELQVREVDGTQSVRLLAWPSLAADVKWSPDGAQVLFRGRPDSTTSGVYLTNRLGGSLRRLADSATAMAFTPDNRNVVLAVGAPGRQALVRFDLGTLNRTDSVAAPAGLSIGDLDPDPRGERFATMARVHGIYNVVGLLTPSGRLLDTVSAPGRNVVRWTPDGRGLLVFVFSPGIADDLYRFPVAGDRINGAGRSIVLGQVATAYRGRFDVARSGRLAVVAAPTTHALKARRIDRPAEGWIDITTRTSYLASPAISPDGSRIAASTTDNIGDNIYLFPVGGGAPQALTSGPGSRVYPLWSPDGRRLAYVSYAPAGLAVTAVAGGRERIILPAALWIDGLYAWVANDALVLGRPDSLVVLDTLGQVRAGLPIPDSLAGLEGPVQANPVTATVVYWSSRAHGLVTVDLGARRFRLLAREPKAVVPLGWSSEGVLLGRLALDPNDPAAPASTLLRAGTDRRWTPVLTLERGCPVVQIGGGGHWLVCATFTITPDVWLADRAGVSGW